jgi:predicted amidohydrolase YtcJ
MDWPDPERYVGCSGSIEVDKPADFAIVDRDPLSVPIDEVPEIRVMETVIGGETVWSRPR